jgi:hypothetical protein
VWQDTIKYTENLTGETKMYELIVLGLIPGTQIQITFLLWLGATIVLAGTYAGWHGHRTRAFRNWIITLSLFRITRQPIQDWKA